MWRAATVAVLTALAASTAGAAVAAPVAPSPKKVAAATAAVGSCGTLSGIGISWTSTANVVTAVALTAVPAACVGGTLSLTLVGAGNAALGSVAPVTVTGTSQTLSTVTGSPTATSVTGAHVSIV